MGRIAEQTVKYETEAGKTYAFRPLISQTIINKRVDTLGKAIARDYAGRTPFFLGVMTGAMTFTSNLMNRAGRHNPHLHAEMGVIELRSYQNGSTRSHTIRQRNNFDQERIAGRDLIIVDDIIDSGSTMLWLHRILSPGKKEKAPASVAVAALVRKPQAMQHKVTVNYPGFDIYGKDERSWVVGYGLDFAGKGRELPFLAVPAPAPRASLPRWDKAPALIPPSFR